MSIQIKKKFIGSQVIDGSKILFLNDEAFKALKADGETEVSLFKVGSDDKLKFLEVPQLASDPVAAEDMARKGYVDTEVSAEESRAMAAESDLQDAITALSSSGGAAVAGVQSELDDTQVGAGLSSAGAYTAPVGSNYLGSAVSLKDADSKLDAAIKAEVDARIADVDAEQSRAEAAEGALDGRLDSIEGIVTSSSVTLTGSGPATITASDLAFAVSGTIDFGGKVLNSVGDGVAADDAATKGQVDAEASARSAADSALDARLDIIEGADTVAGSVAKALKDAKAYTDVEQARAESAESALDARLDVLEGADTVAGSVAKALKDAKAYTDAEQARAEAAEGVLDGKIATEKGRIDAILLAADADKDSFAEIVSLINSVDTTNDNAFAAYVLSNDAALAQEVSDRAAADSALDGRLDVLEADPVTLTYVDEQIALVSNGFDSALSQEISDRQAADALLLPLAGGTMAGDIAMDGHDLLSAGKIAAQYIEIDSAAASSIVSGTSITLDAPVVYVASTGGPVTIETNGGNISAASVSGAFFELSDTIGLQFTGATGQVMLPNGSVLSENGLTLSTAGSTIYFAQLDGVIDGLASPQSDQQAATKGYVDLAVTDEFNSRVAADADLQAAIDQEIADRGVAVAAEQARAEGAESALSGRLDILEGDASTAGSVAKAEADAKAYADQKISDLVDGAPALLDTLNELAAAINDDENFAVTIAGQISALDTRADALEVASVEFKPLEKFVLSSTDISNGYITLSYLAIQHSLRISVDRLAIHQGAANDYTVSTVGGVTRITFVNSLVTPGQEKLSVGDEVYVEGAKRAIV